MSTTVTRPGLNNLSLNNITASGLDIAGSFLTDYISDNAFNGIDSDVGRVVGTALGTSSKAAINTMTSNLIKGNALTQGLGKNVGGSLLGSGVGLASNFAGQSITSAIGDTPVGRGIGTGIGTALGGIGGTAISNLMKGERAFAGLFTHSKSTLNAIQATKDAAVAAKLTGNAAKATELTSKAADMLKASKFARNSNLFGLAGSAVGAGLSAAFGPSKEYGGTYGFGTQIADTAYDAVQTAAGFFGPVGSIVSGVMALNKGLSNAFGSTDGMTVQDAILGSAWMPAPIKWLNMAGAKTTGAFYNQSWQNAERTNAFMQNAFGDLSERFDKARKEAGKTYGTFSRSAYNKAQDNLDFANNSWDKILNMTDQNEWQNIRSQAMSSINNQRYAQNIQGGWNPVYRGKQGMKIFNNATNHNIGMRLLSGAALVDSKQMILCGAID